MCGAPGGFPSEGRCTPVFLGPAAGSPAAPGRTRAARSSGSVRGASLSASALRSDTQLLSECTGVLPTDLIGLDLDVFEWPKKRYIIIMIIIIDYPASVSHFFVFKGNLKNKTSKGPVL